MSATVYSKSSQLPTWSSAERTERNDDAESVISFAISDYDNDNMSLRGTSFRSLAGDDDIGGHSNILINCCITSRAYLRSRGPAILVAFLIFVVLTGASAGILVGTTNSQESETQSEAVELAQEALQLIDDRLDRATLPLFSLSQFVTEIPVFHDLHIEIGAPNASESLPYISETRRDLTGSLCEDEAIVDRFVQVAGTIHQNSRMEEIVQLLELLPYGVICLIYPGFDSLKSGDADNHESIQTLGLDLLSPAKLGMGHQTLENGDIVTLSGPTRSCFDDNCRSGVETTMIARLPVRVQNYEMDVPDADGEDLVYPYWGFVQAQINWAQLMKESGVYDTFAKKGFEFQLTRHGTTPPADGQVFVPDIVLLAESNGFDESNSRIVEETITSFVEEEWTILVTYPERGTRVWLIPTLVLLSLGIAYLVFKILLQKKEHTKMLALNLAQETKVDTERNMTAYFAHELRNPLSAMDSALKAMPDEDVSGPAKELITGMRICASFMSSIMNNLLDVRKMEEGKLTLNRAPMRLDHLVESLHRMFLPNVKKGVAFTWRNDIDTRERKWVLGDNHRLQQVLTNVITNALKYTTAGSVTLSVGWEDTYEQMELQAEDAKARTSLVDFTGAIKDLQTSTSETQRDASANMINPRVRLACADTGPGIMKSQQDDLFKKFVKRGGAPGTGLGLAIAKHLVTLMGGEIYFESDPTLRPGTTCIILVPMPLCHGMQTEDSLDKVTRQKTEAMKVDPIEDAISILIIDDIKMNRMMLRRRFQKAVCPNATFQEATTGEEALEICKTESFDMILVDQYMEDAGGLILGTDTIIAMRRMRIQSLIIGCSGNDMDKEFKEAGADHCWQKPLPSNAKIIKQIQNHMDLQKKNG